MTEPSRDLVVQSTAYSRASLEERRRYTAALAEAGDLLPPNYQGGMVRDAVTQQMRKVGSAGKIMLMAETGDMLGIHPMAALVGVHIIEGKPSISANLMTGLVRKAGHRLRISTTGSITDLTFKARAELVRSDDPEFTYVVEWDIDRAQRADLFPGKPKSNWEKYPEAMLKARAVSEVIREGASDVLMGGNVYTPEELGAQVTEQGDPVDLMVVSQDGTPSPTEPRVETPVQDTAPEATGDFDWTRAVANAASAEEVRDLYKRARSEGLLDMQIRVGKNTVELGATLVDIGRAMAEAEEAADAAHGDDPVEAQVEPDDGAPAVLAEPPADDNVQDAEVVE